MTLKIIIMNETKNELQVGKWYEFNLPYHIHIQMGKVFDIPSEDEVVINPWLLNTSGINRRNGQFYISDLSNVRQLTDEEVIKLDLENAEADIAQDIIDKFGEIEGENGDYIPESLLAECALLALSLDIDKELSIEKIKEELKKK
jgi:hypothetical protein